jgi:hypothetical protein
LKLDDSPKSLVVEEVKIKKSEKPKKIAVKKSNALSTKARKK